MVVRLEGKVDGQDVIFSRKEGDVWETTIPCDIDGTYIVELTAYDDFGNIGFKTTVLVTFHSENMHIEIQPFPWKAELMNSKYNRIAEISKYCSDFCFGEFVASADMSSYYAQVLVHECGVMT